MQLSSLLVHLTFLFGIWMLTAGTDYDVDDCCKIENLSEPAYITASFESFPLLLGCVSKERTDEMQEVHALILNMDSSRTRLQPQSNMTVDVIIKDDTQFQRETQFSIIILSSALPMTWRIHSEKTFNVSSALFLINKNSQIIHYQKKKLKTKKVGFPKDANKLEKWIRRRWKVLTTFTELSLANLISVKIGIDPSANEKCKIVRNLPNTFASYVEVQQAKGCIAQCNHGINDRDIHIIELLSSGINSKVHNRSEVIFNIRSKSRPAIHKHLVLILKSHQAVNWRIVTYGLDGTVDIITDQSVHSIGIPAFRVAAERLAAYQGKELIAWTYVNYGQLISYTVAPLANQFDFNIDDQQLKNINPTTINEERRATAKRSKESEKKIKLSVISTMFISCLNGDLTVSVEKSALQYRNIFPSYVSFINISCEAKVNGTHYVLFAKNNTCGTRCKVSHDAIICMNSIVVNWDATAAAARVRSSRSNGRHFDDELDFMEPLTLNMSCEYPLATTSKDVSVASSNDIQFRLKLFRDGNYSNEITTFPATISEGDHFIVQANITADEGINVVIRNCLLESDDSLTGSSTKKWPLIINGCVSEESVKRIRSESKNEQFQFLFKRFILDEEQHIINLKCDLSICTQHHIPELTGSLQCEDKEFQCISSHADIIVSLFRGPLILAPFDSDKQTYGANSQIVAEEICEQVIRVEGIGTEVVVSIAFTAFIIGVLLTASLWCIYVRTGPVYKNKGLFRSAFTSGDSTPSSTAPITIHQVTAPH